MRPCVYIDTVGPVGPLGPDDAVVVIDVIRSTTTAVTAVALGRRCFPVGSIAEAFAVAGQLGRPLLVGEVRGDPPAGFHLTNSPAQIAARQDVWRPMVLLSSSGMPLLASVAHHPAVYVACLRNVSAVARRLAERHRDVWVLGAPTLGELREEDQLCCARVAEHLLRAGWAAGDAYTGALVERWSGAPPEAFLGSRSVAYLRRTGQLADLELILTHSDDLEAAHVLRRGQIVALAGADQRSSAHGEL